MKSKDLTGPDIGESVLNWQRRPLPCRIKITGRWCEIEPLGRRHVRDLFAAYVLDQDHRNWTYLSYGPFTQESEFRQWVDDAAEKNDPLMFAILVGGKAVGVASYLRIDPDNGVIEIGHIHLSPLLQRTRAATEAMYLFMQYVFADLGYRRYEWKCDSLNAPSRRAATRLGFVFEGIFRQAAIYKGRNRDTAWYSIIDKEWPDLDRAYRAWLDDGNFDAEGMQRRPLRAGRTQ